MAYIEIDASQFSQPHEEDRVTVWPSPYNVPQAVGSSLDEETGRWVVVFEYIGGEEPLVQVNAEEHSIEEHTIDVLVGQQSGRVYRIELDPAFVSQTVNIGERLKSSIEKTHRKLLQQRSSNSGFFSFPRKPARLPEDYEPVEQVITAYGSKLFGPT